MLLANPVCTAAFAAVVGVVRHARAFSASPGPALRQKGKPMRCSTRHCTPCKSPAVAPGHPLSPPPRFHSQSWHFFRARLRYEEALLVQFFGPAYVAYRARTPTFIPFLR